MSPKLSKEEIELQITKLKQARSILVELANFQDTTQHAYKIFLNSIYGAQGSTFYSCYDLDNAESVTKSGQTVLREMLEYTTNKLENLAPVEVADYIVAGDTDSVDKNTNIYVNNTSMTIENLFNTISTTEECVNTVLPNGTEIVYNNDSYECDTLNGKSNIMNVSRHKVTKEKWNISINGDSVITTGDHSIMVQRDGRIIETTPKDILDTDKLIVKRKIKNNG